MIGLVEVSPKRSGDVLGASRNSFKFDFPSNRTNSLFDMKMYDQQILQMMRQSLGAPANEMGRRVSDVLVAGSNCSRTLADEAARLAVEHIEKWRHRP